jgi:hypothetical protein
MFRNLIGAAAIAAALGFTAATADAAVILDDLPKGTYITVGGLDWTWASPVSAVEWAENILYAPSLHAGWRYATEDEFAARPSAWAFVRPDETIINSAAYWNSYYTHVDFDDGLGGYLARTPDGGPYDIWYVREAVPELATWAMLVVGFGAVGTMVRARRPTGAARSGDRG